MNIMSLPAGTGKRLISAFHFQMEGANKFFYMVTTIALGIVLGFLILGLAPYIIGLAIYMVMLPFIAIAWIYEKLTK